MRAGRAARRGPVALAVLVVCLLLASCGLGGGARDDLQAALLADPMAASDLAGLEQVREDIPESAGPFGKSRPPTVSRWFDAGPDAGQAHAQLVALAADEGWQERAELSRDGVWSGVKPGQDDTTMKIIIEVEAGDGAGELVRVTLSYL